jgi:hypothetical protein
MTLRSLLRTLQTVQQYPIRHPRIADDAARPGQAKLLSLLYPGESPSSAEIVQMFVVTSEVANAGREFAETNDPFASLSGRQVRVTE